MSESKNNSGSNACHLLSTTVAIDDCHKSLASKQAIRKIFRIIEQKDSVVIKEGVKLFNTGLPCDGVILNGESPRYILVVPRTNACK